MPCFEAEVVAYFLQVPEVGDPTEERKKEWIFKTDATFLSVLRYLSIHDRVQLHIFNADILQG